MATLEPDSVPFIMYIGENWIFKDTEFVLMNDRLSFYLDRNKEFDLGVEVLYDS